MRQQMFNGGSDKSGSGRKPRVKDAGNPVVDLLIKTETHNTILSAARLDGRLAFSSAAICCCTPQRHWHKQSRKNFQLVRKTSLDRLLARRPEGNPVARERARRLPSFAGRTGHPDSEWIARVNVYLR
jgi:hypothetical protein